MVASRDTMVASRDAIVAAWDKIVASRDATIAEAIIRTLFHARNQRGGDISRAPRLLSDAARKPCVERSGHRVRARARRRRDRAPDRAAVRTSIVAIDDGGTWSGVSGLGLPYP